MMDQVLAEFAREVSKVKLSAPKIPYISNVTGTWIQDAEAIDPQYWATHLRQTVRFAAGTRRIGERAGRDIAGSRTGQNSDDASSESCGQVVR